MKVRELLLESYLDGYYHLSNKKDLKKSNVNVASQNRKHINGKYMGGFWIAKGKSWYNFLQSNPDLLARKGNKYIYRVKIKPTAKLMPFINDYMSGLVPIKKEYRKESIFGKEYKETNWEKLVKDYEGISYLNLGKALFSAGIDVPSIVIWDRKAIQDIEFLGDTEEVLKLNLINKLQKKGNKNDKI